MPSPLVSAKEIDHIRQDFEKANATLDKTGISEDEFKEVSNAYYPASTPSPLSTP
jgi:hypothetical protein